MVRKFCGKLWRGTSALALMLVATSPLLAQTSEAPAVDQSNFRGLLHARLDNTYEEVVAHRRADDATMNARLAELQATPPPGTANGDSQRIALLTGMISLNRLYGEVEAITYDRAGRMIDTLFIDADEFNKLRAATDREVGKVTAVAVLGGLVAAGSALLPYADGGIRTVDAAGVDATWLAQEKNFQAWLNGRGVHVAAGLRQPGNPTNDAKLFASWAQGNLPLAAEELPAYQTLLDKVAVAQETRMASDLVAAIAARARVTGEMIRHAQAAGVTFAPTLLRDWQVVAAEAEPMELMRQGRRLGMSCRLGIGLGGAILGYAAWDGINTFGEYQTDVNNRCADIHRALQTLQAEINHAAPNAPADPQAAVDHKLTQFITPELQQRCRQLGAQITAQEKALQATLAAGGIGEDEKFVMLPLWDPSDYLPVYPMK